MHKGEIDAREGRSSAGRAHAKTGAGERGGVVGASLRRLRRDAAGHLTVASLGGGSARLFLRCDC